MTWEGAKHNSQCAWVLSHHYTHDNAAKKTTVLKLCLLWFCAPKWGGHPATLEQKSIPHKAGLRHRPWPGAPHVQGISKVKYFANIAEKFAYKKRQCMFTNHMTIQAYLTKDTDFEGTVTELAKLKSRKTVMQLLLVIYNLFSFVQSNVLLSLSTLGIWTDRRFTCLMGTLEIFWSGAPQKS